jgi:hypothetical protein
MRYVHDSREMQELHKYRNIQRLPQSHGSSFNSSLFQSHGSSFNSSLFRFTDSRNTCYRVLLLSVLVPVVTVKVQSAR